MIVVAVLLTIAGALAVIAPIEWRAGRWLASGNWVVRRIGAPAVAGAPAVGLMVASIGWMLVWPPAVVIAVGSAIWWLVRMRNAARAQEQTPAAPNRRVPRATGAPLRAAPEAGTQGRTLPRTRTGTGARRRPRPAGGQRTTRRV